MNLDQKRGKLLRKLRKENNLTQRDLGELIHYSDKNISKWERGISFPTNPTLLNGLATSLHVSVDELMFGEKKVDNNQEDIREYFHKKFQENYQKYHKTISTLFIITLIVILLLLVSIYLIFIKDSVKVYSISFENEHITPPNSILLVTNKLSVLNFHKIEVSTNKNIKNLYFYYLDEDKEKVRIFSGGNENYHLQEQNGYLEYQLDSLVDKKVYLDITYEDNSVDTTKVIFQEVYTNDNIFPKKVARVSVADPSNDFSKFSDKLVKLGFPVDNDCYEIKFSPNAVVFYIENTNYIYAYVSYDNVLEILTGLVNSSDIYYEKYNYGALVEHYKLQEKGSKNCLTEECSTTDDFAKFINFLIKDS